MRCTAPRFIGAIILADRLCRGLSGRTRHGVGAVGVMRLADSFSWFLCMRKLAIENPHRRTGCVPGDFCLIGLISVALSATPVV